MRWRLLLLSYLSLVCFGLADNSRGPLYPELLSEFSLTPKAGAWIFALASLAGLCSNLSSSRWLPFLSQVSWMRVALILMGLGTFYYDSQEIVIQQCSFGLRPLSLVLELE